MPAETAPPLPARRMSSRRGRWLGSAIALIGLALLGGLAWTLTHAPKPASAAADGAAGPRGPGGRGGPPSTGGLAAAREADIPVLLEALGTVTPAANVTVRPQVSGVLTQVLFKEGQTAKKAICSRP